MERFDVAVIGAGVVGVATARRLALEGRHVVLIEKGLDILSGSFLPRLLMLMRLKLSI